MRRFVVVLVCLIAMSFGVCLAKSEGGDIFVEDGKRVSFEYALIVDGEIVDTSEGKEPFEYIHGESNILPGLAKQLEGLKVGDEKTIEVVSDEAYGPVDLEAFREVPMDRLPQGVPPQVGMPLQVKNADGSMIVVSIAEVKEGSVIIDFNHPLAGKDLVFNIKVISIQ